MGKKSVFLPIFYSNCPKIVNFYKKKDSYLS